MPTAHKYKRPPVVEALCEVYFNNSQWTQNAIAQIAAKLFQKFPIKRSKDIHRATWQFSDTGSSGSIDQPAPWTQLLTPSANRMVQVAQDILSINQLTPYSHFEDWEPDIYTAMNVYRDAAHPSSVQKMGVRYINRIVIPGERVQVEDYFTIAPRIPEGFKQEHGPFMLRIEVPNQKGNHSVFITFSLAPHEPNTVAFLLDLYDTFQPGPEMEFSRLKAEVEFGHENIRTAFEGSITDKMRQLFDSGANQ